MTEDEAKIRIRDSVLRSLKHNHIVARLTDGRVFAEGDIIQTPCVVVTMKDGGWLGSWPLPGEKKQVQHDATVTSIASDLRLAHGLVKAVQKALAVTPQHREEIVDHYILTGTPPIETKDGVHSRGDVFGVIATVEG